MSEDDCDNDNCDNGPNMFLTMCPLWSLTGDKQQALHVNRNSKKEGGNLGDITSVCT